MRIVTRLAAAAIVGLALSGAARADDNQSVERPAATDTSPAAALDTGGQSPEAIAVATELMSVVSPDLMGQLMTQMTNALWPGIVSRAKQRNVDDATLAEFRTEFDRIQLDNLQKMMKEAPPIYARYFTVEELRELIAFYKTPIGQKAITQLPQVMGAFMKRVAPVLGAVQSETADAYRRVLKAHGYDE